jgi:electron transfer flavoprotein alpha subunit
VKAQPAIVFGGDRLHEADCVRCEKLVAAARRLWPLSEVALILGLDTMFGCVEGVRQDADAAVDVLCARFAEQAGLSFAFSSNDRFSAHVARLLSARTGAPLLGPVVAVHGDRVTCVDRRRIARAREMSPGQVLLVDERYFSRPSNEAARAATAIATRDAASRIAFADVQVSSGAVPLGEADLVMSAGDGITGWDDFLAVAERLGATVGASKVVCDKGLLPRDRQVGSSGTAVSPRVYIALGISGSTQHLQGIGESTRVLAVNTDPHAAIVQRADLAIVTDANALLRGLRAVLEEDRA